MKNRIIILVITFVFVMGYIVYEGVQLNNKFKSFSGADSNGTVIKTMPDVSFKLLNNNGEYHFQKEDFGKKSLFLHFWATWCGPCEAEFPELAKIIEASKDKDIRFVFVAVNDDVKKINKFLKKFPNLNALIVIDNDFIHQKFFGTYRLPETFLIDSNGEVVKKYTGAKKWSLELLTPVLSTKLLKKQVESH